MTLKIFPAGFENNKKVIVNVIIVVKEKITYFLNYELRSYKNKSLVCLIRTNLT